RRQTSEKPGPRPLWARPLHASHGGRGRGEVEALFTSSSNGDPRTVDPHIEGPDAVSSGHARLRTRSGSQSLYRKTFATHHLTQSESVDREVQGVSTERCQNDAVCRHLIGSSSPAYGSFRNAAQRPGAVDAAFTGPVSWPPPETRLAGGNNMDAKNRVSLWTGRVGLVV